MLRSKRPQILTGMALGALWGVLVIGLPQWLGLPYIPAPIALPGAFLAPGLVLALMIGRLAQRRFFDDAIIDGEPFAPGSAAETDQRVLTNTVEQLVLALAIWPFAAVTLGGAVAIALGLSFAVDAAGVLGRLPPVAALAGAGFCRDVLPDGDFR